MAGTRAAVIKLDPPETYSVGGIVTGFTTLEAEALQEYNKTNNTNSDPSGTLMGETVRACGDDVKIGWIFDGSSFRDPNS